MLCYELCNSKTSQPILRYAYETLLHGLVMPVHRHDDTIIFDPVIDLYLSTTM